MEKQMIREDWNDVSNDSLRGLPLLRGLTRRHPEMTGVRWYQEGSAGEEVRKMTSHQLLELARELVKADGRWAVMWQFIMEASAVPHQVMLLAERYLTYQIHWSYDWVTSSPVRMILEHPRCPRSLLEKYRDDESRIVDSQGRESTPAVLVSRH